MKKLLFLVPLFACLVLTSGMARPPKKSTGPTPREPKTKMAAPAGRIVLDNFETGDYKKKWWEFDNAVLTIEKNTHAKGENEVAASTGVYSLNLAGEAKNWYIGGCGSYLGLDASKYSAVEIDVLGFGAQSGTLKIELYEDDNGNWEAEQDKAKNYAPLFDDKWVSEQKVDWDGWRRIRIPFSDFVDDNPGVGDDQWNPDQSGGSGGLLQIQFIILAPTEKGYSEFNVDNISLVQ